MSEKNKETTQPKEKEVLTATQNPAILVKTQKLPTKAEFAQDQSKKEQPNEE